MDYLRLFLLISAVACGAEYLAHRGRAAPTDSGWRTRLTSELVAGRSASSALLNERGEETRKALHDACRGLPLGSPEGDESASLLLRAALIAREASFKKTEEAVSTVKAVLESFDSNEARLKDLVSSAAFRGTVLSAALCFLVPFFVEMLPLLGALQGGNFSILPGDPTIRDMGAALALIASYYLSSIASSEGKGQAWGRMAAFASILFVSTSLAASLPLVGSI